MLRRPRRVAAAWLLAVMTVVQLTLCGVAPAVTGAADTATEAVQDDHADALACAAPDGPGGLDAAAELDVAVDPRRSGDDGFAIGMIAAAVPVETDPARVAQRRWHPAARGVAGPPASGRTLLTCLGIART